MEKREITMENVLEYIMDNTGDGIPEYYDRILEDDRLKLSIINKMTETPEIIRLWQKVCHSYRVTDDPFFFLYALYQYKLGIHLEYDVCFLYGESKALREDATLNEMLKGLAKEDITNYTLYRGITREEKIKENEDLGVCPFGDVIGSASHLCKKYKNCNECQENTYEDKIYVSFLSLLHQTQPLETLDEKRVVKEKKNHWIHSL